MLVICLRWSTMSQTSEPAAQAAKIASVAHGFVLFHVFLRLFDVSDTPSNMGGLDALITPLWNTGVVPSSSLWVTWAYSLVDFKANPNQKSKTRWGS